MHSTGHILKLSERIEKYIILLLCNSVYRSALQVQYILLGIEFEEREK
jgi:hypothetical protein